MDKINIEIFLQKFLAYLPRMIIAIIILVISLFLIKKIAKIIAKGLTKGNIEQTAHKFILSASKFSLYALMGILILYCLGVPITTLITALGAIGVAITLAVKDSLANISGGLIILFAKPFVVGDYISNNDGSEGTVTSIDILYTKLNTIDNKAIFIPNGEMSKSQITNFSAEDIRRLDIIFSISYSDDFEKAKKIIMDIIMESDLSLKEPSPIVRVCDHAPSSINITSRVWVKTENYWELNFYLHERVKVDFDKQNITIPFNQLEVNLLNKTFS